MTLHEQITAKLDEIEFDLLKAGASSTFTDEVDACTCGTSGMAPYGHEPGCGTEPGPYWWIVSFALRAVAEDREVLKRHEAKWNGRDDWCPICWVDEDRPLHPCPEVLSLARRLGVEATS
jgi:hypothetical protein